MPKVSLEHEQMRRQQILDAALACFSRRGYHSTSMEDIAREAGLSIGALYTYFSSKEDLFFALADVRFQDNMARLRELFGSAGSSVSERLERGLNYFFAALDEEIGPWSHLMLEWLSQSHTMQQAAARERQHCAELHAMFQVLLEEGIARGECRADLDAEASADLLLALGDGVVMHWIHGGLSSDRERLKKAFKQLVGRGILGISPALGVAEPAADVRAAEPALAASTKETP
jgi:AcrR family transcriptional regulator